MTNQDYMKRALELAKKAMGYTSPNPMVGCVVVKDGRIVTEGYHERCGEYHAERNALTKCSEDLTGATRILYWSVALEKYMLARWTRIRKWQEKVYRF